MYNNYDNEGGGRGRLLAAGFVLAVVALYLAYFLWGGGLSGLDPFGSTRRAEIDAGARVAVARADAQAQTAIAQSQAQAAINVAAYNAQAQTATAVVWASMLPLVAVVVVVALLGGLAMALGAFLVVVRSPAGQERVAVGRGSRRRAGRGALPPPGGYEVPYIEVDATYHVSRGGGMRYVEIERRGVLYVE